MAKSTQSFDRRGSQLVFIVGHYKSGSTWLANMLSLHSAIRGLRETHLFRYSSTGDFQHCTEQIFSSVAWAEGGRRNLLRHRLGVLARPLRKKGQATLKWHERPTTLLDLSLVSQVRLRHDLERIQDIDAYRVKFFSELFRLLDPPRFLLEKTPTNMPFIPEIRRVFPDCKLLAVYRDGRDAVVSDRYHLKNEYGREQDFPVSVRNWRDAMVGQLEAEDRYGVNTFAYETLLQNPHGVAERILRLLDLKRDPGMIEDMVERSSFRFVTGRTAGEEERRSFYRKGTRGDWRTELSNAEKQQFAEIAGDLLVRLGYEESADPATWRDG